MGDVRFRHPYERVRDAPDPVAAVRALGDEDLVAALSAASSESDLVLANVLTTELQNRVRRTGTVGAAMGDGVLAADWRGRITYLNPAGERLVSVPRTDAVGQDVVELLNPRLADGRPFVESGGALEDVLTEGRPVRRDDLFLAPGHREPFPADCTISPIMREGEYAGFVFVFRDVTERKRAETERLREILQATLGGGLPRPRASPEERAATAQYGPTAAPEPGPSWLSRTGPSPALAQVLNYPLLDRLTVGFIWVSLAVLALTLYTPLGGPAAGSEESPFGFPGLSGMPGGVRGAILEIGLVAALAGTAAWRWLAPRQHFAWRLVAAAALTLFTPLFSLVVGGSGEGQLYLLLVTVWVAAWADWRIPWFAVGAGALLFGVLTFTTPGWLEPSQFTLPRLLARIAPAVGVAAVAALLSSAYHQSTRALQSARNVLSADLIALGGAEEATRASEAHYRSLFESSPDAILIVKPNFVMAEVNPALSRMTGYARGELCGTDMAHLYVDADEYRDVQDAFRKHARTGDPFTRVVRFRRKTGDTFPAHLTGASVRDPGGRTLRFVEIVRDLSAPTPAGPAVLHEAEDALEQVARASPVPMIVVDPEGRVTVWNAAAEDTFGWSWEEVVGDRLPIVPSDRQEEFHRYLAEMHRGHALKRREAFRRRKDGTLVRVRLSLAPFRTPQGELRRVIGVLEREGAES